MKTLSALLIGLTLTGTLVFSHASTSFAEEAEHGPADIQVIKDAAAALKVSNPELSEKLTKYADREEKEMKEEEENEKK